MAVIVCEFPPPYTAGVYVTVQTPLAFNVQVVTLNWAAVPELVLHETVPEGVVEPPPNTVTRQVVGAFIASGFGVQTTVVVVPRTASRVNAPLPPT